MKCLRVRVYFNMINPAAKRLRILIYRPLSGKSKKIALCGLCVSAVNKIKCGFLAETLESVPF